MIKLLTFFLTLSPILGVAASAEKNVKNGECTPKGAQVEFTDGSRQLFSNTKGYQCDDFKISPNRKYAGWKLVGEITIEKDGVKQAPLPDAILYVSAGSKSYPVTESSRYINNWYFVSGANQIVAETSFEHGPSTYVLFDIEKMKATEACGQFELPQCKKLHFIVKSKS